MQHIIGAVLISIGVLFLFLGSLGIIRMPDVFNRIQTGTKATTFGSIFTIIGVGIYNLAFLPKAILIVLFILLTNPISSHITARRAYFMGVKKTDKTVKDELGDEQNDA